MSLLNGPLQWPPGAPENAGHKIARIWEHRRESGERLGVWSTSLGAHQSSVELAGNNDILFGNAAGAPVYPLREKTRLLLMDE
jgi:hypothetical protein